MKLWVVENMCAVSVPPEVKQIAEDIKEMKIRGAGELARAAVNALTIALATLEAEAGVRRLEVSVFSENILGQMVKKKNSDSVRERRILPVVLEPLEQAPDLDW
jgi:translation initiation factor 2B subunit (eIF-2B alpha/beta/delta family)